MQQLQGSLSAFETDLAAKSGSGPVGGMSQYVVANKP